MNYFRNLTCGKRNRSAAAGATQPPTSPTATVGTNFMKRLTYILIIVIFGGYDLSAQKTVNDSKFDTIRNSRLISFEIIGIADTIKVNTKGFILDCTDNLPICNASILFGDSSNNKWISYCSSDTSGFFSKWINSGKYDIKIQMVGYCDFKLRNQIIKSGNLISMRVCLMRQPDEGPYPEPIVLPYDSKKQK